MNSTTAPPAPESRGPLAAGGPCPFSCPPFPTGRPLPPTPTARRGRPRPPRVGWEGLKRASFGWVARSPSSSSSLPPQPPNLQAERREASLWQPRSFGGGSSLPGRGRPTGRRTTRVESIEGRDGRAARRTGGGALLGAARRRRQARVLFCSVLLAPFGSNRLAAARRARRPLRRPHLRQRASCVVVIVVVVGRPRGVAAAAALPVVGGRALLGLRTCRRRCRHPAIYRGAISPHTSVLTALSPHNTNLPTNRKPLPFSPFHTTMVSKTLLFAAAASAVAG